MKTEELTPVIDQLVQEQLATGKYRSREEVLVRALRQLAEHDHFLADLDAAAEDEAAGRLVDAQDVFAVMEAKYNISHC